MMGQVYSRRIHEYFQRWRYQAELVTVAKDCNEQGPVVEEVLGWRVKLHSLKYFMNDEGFEKHQIEDETESAKQKSNELIARAVARWKCANVDEDDSYLLPKMFDRWREFVRLRKLVGWILSNMENRLQPTKADMSYAFNKWKYGTGNSKKKLGGTHRAVKKVSMVNNQQKLE